MNILWIKDNNIGHEKQVKVLLDELSKNNDLNIDQRTVKGFIPFFRYIDDVQKNYYDILIGAGHKTYSFLLDIKKYQKHLQYMSLKGKMLDIQDRVHGQNQKKFFVFNR